MEEIKLQIQSLYTLRNTYINILALLIGGVIGLICIEDKTILIYCFIFIGFIFILFLIFIIFNCMNKLQLLFKNLKEFEKL